MNVRTECWTSVALFGVSVLFGVAAGVNGSAKDGIGLAACVIGCVVFFALAVLRLPWDARRGAA